MSLDELAREATQSLRTSIERDVDPVAMLPSVRRTRVRRRIALVAVPVALATLVGAAVSSGVRPTHQDPVSRPPAVGHANGVLLGLDNPALSGSGRLHLPPLSASSSPTWSSDGRELAVLAHGIRITDVATGTQRVLPCPGCGEIAWSPDGTRFAAVRRSGDGIVLVDATSGLMSYSWLRTVTNLESLTWSPDGDSLAFVADERSNGDPRVQQGAFVFDLVHPVLRLLLTGPLTDSAGHRHPARMLAVSWNPTRDSIAVLTANTAGRRVGPADLGVVSVNASGGRISAALAGEDACGCAGWSPNLEWSPDGTTLAVYARHDGSRRTLDSDGTPVRIRFVRGSGPLVWQPR